MTNPNPAAPLTPHCRGCRGYFDPEYLRREDCPGVAARATSTPAGLREALAEWDAIEGSDVAAQFRAFIAAGKMADAIRAALQGADR